MIVILGLILVVLATLVGLVGVLDNAGSGHELTGGFSVLGFDVTGSTGELFLYGIVVGAIGMLGLSMLLAGSVRTARRGRVARTELKESRRETAMVSRDRDDLLHQREADHAHQEADVRHTAAPTGDGSPGSGADPPPAGASPR